MNPIFDLFCSLYVGDNCDVDVQECSSNPCLNNAECFEPSLDIFECVCAKGIVITLISHFYVYVIIIMFLSILCNF